VPAELDSWSLERWCCLLCGRSGAGKTWAAVAFAHRSPVVFRYVKARHYVEQVRREIGSDRDGRTQDRCMGIERGCHRGLLLDDLGAERVTDFAAGKIADLLDERYDRQLPTIITTNNTVEDIAKSYGARTASRLSTGLVLAMVGADRRLSAALAAR
jgi:DNA replication protein DnaC